jgi:hypothetical protein
LNVGKEEERSEEEQIAQLEQDFRREEMELGRLEWAWQFHPELFSGSDLISLF